MLPVTKDEAYYFDWASKLAWGYFDHPPGVAVLGIASAWWPGSPWVARLGTVLAATLTLVVLSNLYRRCGLDRRQDRLIALVLAVATLPGLACGVLTTPDTILLLCWALMLNEVLAALQGEERRWLTAGLVTGIGLLGKYTMVLAGPVMLWAILATDWRQLLRPWPYLGGLVALAVFMPHLIWNAQHDWLSMRFQFGHGFSLNAGMSVANDFASALRAGAVHSDPDVERTLIERVWTVSGYLATQLALWGVLAVAVIVAVFRRGETGAIWPEARRLMVAAAVFPLAFFGLIASFSEVEPNWPAMYLLAAAPLLAPRVRRLWRWLVGAAMINVLVVTLYAVHGATGSLPLPASFERVLRETHGYDALAARVAELPGIGFADRYQLVAMLRFYQPGLEITQFPGITRPSEYVRGTLVPTPTLQALHDAGGFWLVTRKAPPEIEGFELTSERVLADCPKLGLVERMPADSMCEAPLHIWRLVDYGSLTSIESQPPGG